MGNLKLNLRIYIFHCFFAVSVLGLSPGNETEVLLTKTLDALDAALTFFHHQHQNVNLDAVIGTRIVECKSETYSISYTYHKI